METLGIIAGGAAVLIALGGLIITWLRKAAYEQGKTDAVNQIAKESDEAKKRADTVLAEHRDPADADKRLHDGTF